MLKGNLLPGEIFYITNKYLDKSENEINDLAAHCAAKLNNSNHININLCNSFNDKVFVLNEDEFKTYKDCLYNTLFFWSINDYENIFKDESIEQIDLRNKLIYYVDIFQLILYFCDELNNIDFTYSLIKKLSLLILCDNNNKILLKNDIICCWLFDKMFENFENENELSKLIFKETENLYIKIFINSLIKATNDENLVIKLETILIWGSNKKNSYKDEEVFKFIRLILYDIYKRLNSIDDAKIFQYQNKSIEINIDNNFFLKNYLYITIFIYL